MPAPAGPTRAFAESRPPERATRIQTPADEPTRVDTSGGSSLSAIKVTGQALAAVTAAGVGAALGGAGGTVAGAGIAAVVTTVGDAVYQRSIERTRDHVRTRLQSRRPGREDTPDPAGPQDDPTVVIGASGAAATQVVEAPGADDAPPPGRPWRRYALLVATGLLIFLVALLAITGIERIKGSPLSGGENGTSVGSVLGGGEATTTTTAPATEDSAPTDTTAPAATDGATTTTESRAPTTTTGAPRLLPSGLLPGN